MGEADQGLAEARDLGLEQGLVILLSQISQTTPTQLMIGIRRSATSELLLPVRSALQLWHYTSVIVARVEAGALLNHQIASNKVPQ